MRARFDLISWDPRGVGASTAVQCFATKDDEDAFFAGIPFFPVGRAEQRAWIRRYADFGQLCGQRNGDLLAHVSTADTARTWTCCGRGRSGTELPWDLLRHLPRRHVRQLLPGPGAGDGAGRQRRPGRVYERRRGPPFLNVAPARSDLASAKTLNAFLGLCGQASTDRCVFSAGSPAATQAKWTTLLQRVREHRATFDDRTITYAVLVSAMSGWLTTTEPQPWPTAARLPGLDARRGGAATAVGAERPRRPTGRRPCSRFRKPHHGSGSAARRASAGVVQSYQGPERGSRWPARRRTRATPAFLVLDPLTDARAGDLGPWWIWTYDEPCASWPAAAADRYAGPWDRPTANPILVIGNTFDPETPHEGAVAMADELARDYSPWTATAAPS